MKTGCHIGEKRHDFPGMLPNRMLKRTRDNSRAGKAGLVSWPRRLAWTPCGETDLKMSGFDLDTYARWLYSHCSGARVLRREEITVGAWIPQPKMCHKNASDLYQLDDRYVPVRGWLYFDLPGLPYVKFVSHSATKTPEGGLVDITPKARPEADDYPFIDGGLSEDEYKYLVEDCGYGEINLPLEKA